MKRSLLLSLLLSALLLPAGITYPVFAQIDSIPDVTFPSELLLNEPMRTHPSLSRQMGMSQRDASLSHLQFLQKRNELVARLQQVQQMLMSVQPSDQTTIGMLEKEQVELTKQMRDLMIQQPMPLTHLNPADRIQPEQGVSDPILEDRRPRPNMPNVDLATVSTDLKNSPVSPNPPMIPPNDTLSNNAWADTYQTSPFGRRIPQGWTEAAQSINALKKEISELKETVNALETQIQLLNHNILLSEKVKGE